MQIDYKPNDWWDKASPDNPKVSKDHWSPYPLPLPREPVMDLYRARMRAKDHARGYKARGETREGNGPLPSREAEWDADKAFKQAVEALRWVLPFGTSTTHGDASRNRRHPYRNVLVHITVTQDVKIGRFVRKKSDALCVPHGHFTGLWYGHNRDHGWADCPRCAAIAERLAVRPQVPSRTVKEKEADR